MTSYEDQLDAADAPAWMPEPGEKLIGTVVDLDTYRSEYGQGDVPVLTIETESGESYRVICFSTVLRNEVEKKRPQPLDTVGIKYVGISNKKKPGQSAAKIFKFRVFERAQPTPATFGDVLARSEDYAPLPGVDDPLARSKEYAEQHNPHPPAPGTAAGDAAASVASIQSAVTVAEDQDF